MGRLGLRGRRPRFFDAGGRGTGQDGPRPDHFGEHLPGCHASERDPRRRNPSGGCVSPRRRLTFHRRSGMRSSPGHASRESSWPCAITRGATRPEAQGFVTGSSRNRGREFLSPGHPPFPSAGRTLSKTVREACPSASSCSQVEQAGPGTGNPGGRDKEFPFGLAFNNEQAIQPDVVDIHTMGKVPAGILIPEFDPPREVMANGPYPGGNGLAGTDGELQRLTGILLDDATDPSMASPPSPWWLLPIECPQASRVHATEPGPQSRPTPSPGRLGRPRHRSRGLRIGIHHSHCGYRLTQCGKPHGRSGRGARLRDSVGHDG